MYPTHRSQKVQEGVPEGKAASEKDSSEDQDSIFPNSYVSPPSMSSGLTKIWLFQVKQGLYQVPYSSKAGKDRGITQRKLPQPSRPLFNGIAFQFLQQKVQPFERASGQVMEAFHCHPILGKGQAREVFMAAWKKAGLDKELGDLVRHTAADPALLEDQEEEEPDRAQHSQQDTKRAGS